MPPALDAVSRMAMARQPSGPYATPLGLAADIEHWLADEPVVTYHEARALRSISFIHFIRFTTSDSFHHPSQ
jgi:hypothetical protein